MTNQKRANKKRNRSDRSQNSAEMDSQNKKSRSVKDLLDNGSSSKVVGEVTSESPTAANTPKARLDFDTLVGTPKSADAPQWALDLISSVKDLKAEITRLSEQSTNAVKLQKKVNHLERENLLMHQENEDLKEKVLLLEYHQRRNNLVFYGIDEVDGPETGRDCYDKLMQIVSNIPDLDVGAIRIDRCHRLGAKLPNKCRGIIAKFNWYGDLVDILRGRSCLPRGVFVTEDFPDEWSEHRQLLKPILQLARDNPKYKYNCKLVRDKLILDGKQYTVSPRNNLHELPGDIIPSQACEKRDDSTIAFLGPHSVFSNFHTAAFTEGGVSYTSTEQMIQAEKAAMFGDKLSLERIMKTKNPFKVKEIGSRVRGFDRNTWLSACKEIALRAVKAKFSQNPNLRKLLVSTGSLLIVESSPDRLWGTGVHLKDTNALVRGKWNGNGLMSEIVLEVRKSLKK